MILNIIATCIALYSFVNFKRALQLFIIFELVYFPNAKIITFKYFPSIPIYLVVLIIFFVAFLYKRRFKIPKKSCPYSIPLLFLCISRFLTCFTSLSGFFDELSRLVGYFFYSFIFVIIIWQTLESKEDFFFVFKGYCTVFTISGIYGIIECLLKYNPFVHYKSTLTPEGIDFYAIDMFRGYRVTAIFEHPIGTGINCALYIVLTFILFWDYKEHGINIRQFIIPVILSVVCIFLTKMRSSIVFFLIALFGTLNFKKMKTYFLGIITIFLILVLITLFPDKFSIVLSIFNTKARQAVGGSSLGQRIMQFNAAFQLSKQSPIFGLGERAIERVGLYYQDRLLGMESVWLEEIVKRGFGGIIATIVMIIYSVVLIPKKYSCKEAVFISLGYWTVYSMSSLPYVRLSLYFVVLFYCLKFKNINLVSDTRTV